MEFPEEIEGQLSILEVGLCLLICGTKAIVAEKA